MANTIRLPKKNRGAAPAPEVKKDELPVPAARTSRSAIFLGGEPANKKRPARRVVPSLAAEPEEEDEVFIVDEDEVSSILASAEDWDEDSDNDDSSMPGSEGQRAREKEEGLNHRTGAAKNRRKRVQVTLRDVQIIRLLGKYKFGYRTQIEAYCGRKDLSRRLTQLANGGLLRNEKITQNQAVWTPTQAGIELAGLEVPPLTHGRITPVTVAHTVGLLNLGMGFEKGDPGSNLLKDPLYPRGWRRELNPDQSYRLETGETVLTERMITQSWRRQLALHGDVELLRRYHEALAWVPSRPGDANAFGPEADEGNEWMYVGMAPYKAHVPDMVLVRPRNSDGSTRHVAIELELSSKSVPEWRRILEGFKGSQMFSTVAYFTHKRTVREGLMDVNAKHVGLDVGTEFLIMKYVPRLDNPFWG